MSSKGPRKFQEKINLMNSRQYETDRAVNDILSETRMLSSSQNLPGSNLPQNNKHNRKLTKSVGGLPTNQVLGSSNVFPNLGQVNLQMDPIAQQQLLQAQMAQATLSQRQQHQHQQNSVHQNHYPNYYNSLQKRSVSCSDYHTTNELAAAHLAAVQQQHIMAAAAAQFQAAQMNALAMSQMAQQQNSYHQHHVTMQQQQQQNQSIHHQNSEDLNVNINDPLITRHDSNISTSISENITNPINQSNTSLNKSSSNTDANNSISSCSKNLSLEKNIHQNQNNNDSSNLSLSPICHSNPYYHQQLHQQTSSMPDLTKIGGGNGNNYKHDSGNSTTKVEVQNNMNNDIHRIAKTVSSGNDSGTHMILGDCSTKKNGKEPVQSQYSAPESSTIPGPDTVHIRHYSDSRDNSFPVSPNHHNNQNNNSNNNMNNNTKNFPPSPNNSCFHYSPSNPNTNSSHNGSTNNLDTLALPIDHFTCNMNQKYYTTSAPVSQPQSPNINRARGSTHPYLNNEKMIEKSISRGRSVSPQLNQSRNQSQHNHSSQGINSPKSPAISCDNNYPPSNSSTNLSSRHNSQINLSVDSGSHMSKSPAYLNSLHIPSSGISSTNASNSGNTSSRNQLTIPGINTNFTAGNSHLVNNQNNNGIYPGSISPDRALSLNSSRRSSLGSDFLGSETQNTNFLNVEMVGYLGWVGIDFFIEQNTTRQNNINFCYPHCCQSPRSRI